jgi:acetolactate synthase-1/2/3 large subunit
MVAGPLPKVADALISVLSNIGVKYVFGVSGANIEHLHDALHRRVDVQAVLARREDAAAYMADCHARVHRTLGVCCSTSGGGMMNLIAGIAESYAESVPLLAIVGQPPTVQRGRGAFQDSSAVGRAIDAQSMWRSVAKSVRTLDSGADFWPVVTDSLTAALSDRQGPAVLLVPRNVFDEQVPGTPHHWLNAVRSAIAPRPPHPRAVDSLVAALRRSRQPLLIVGQGVRRSSDPTAVVTMARRLGLPVATTMSARAEFPNDDPLYLGTVGVAGHPSVHRFIHEHVDLVVAIGASLDIMTRGPVSQFIGETPVAVISIDPGDVQRLSLAVVAIVEADVGLAAAELSGRAERGELQSRPGVEVPREYFKPRLAAPLPASDVAPLRGELRQSEAVAVLAEHLPVRGHIVLDAGNCASAALHLTEVPEGSSSTIALGMGAMGYAIPASIGAALGSDAETRTVVLAGDGAFLMLGFEIHAAVDLGLPILFVVFNNNMHGMCVTRQQLFFDGRIEAVRYGMIDVEQVARGLGQSGRLWTASAGTVEDLKRALADYEARPPGPGVLELLLGPGEVPPFAPLLPPDEPTLTR